jgi:hypothetical protein
LHRRCRHRRVCWAASCPAVRGSHTASGTLPGSFNHHIRSNLIARSRAPCYQRPVDTSHLA